jgi:hypothetical protein
MMLDRPRDPRNLALSVMNQPLAAKSPWPTNSQAPATARAEPEPPATLVTDGAHMTGTVHFPPAQGRPLQQSALVLHCWP